MRRVLIPILTVFFLCTTAQAGFWDNIRQVFEGKESSPSREGALSQTEIRKGLREALLLSLKRAVMRAGREGGFLNDPAIRIPPPPELARVADLLKRLGLSSQVEAFEVSMNHAAEKAARKAWPVFLKTARGITLQDARQLLNGGDHAITDYFRQKTWQDLYERFLPIVRENLENVGVTKKYQELISSPRIKPYLAYLGHDVSLDRYVTKKALDGLFVLLAQEEKRLREDPTARTTELLKKLFQR